jgi:DNA-directed RNA polymerase specialized sigma24 family protein
MSDESDFGELIRRIRVGDEQAVEELLSRYLPVLKRTLFVRLRNTALQRVVGESDICQSVFNSFCARAALGQYELNRPQDLVNLLMRMAHNKLTAQKRHHEAECRDVNRTGGDPQEVPVVATGPTPSQQVSVKELLSETRRRLSEEEWQLVELRHHQGLEWAEIAERLGGTAEGRRKQLERASDRVAMELNLDE